MTMLRNLSWRLWRVWARNLMVYMRTWQVNFIPPLAALGGLAFGSIAMWMTGITPTIDMFNLPIFLFITPMFLFSGAFFPVDGLPAWASGLAMGLPLYHLTQACRSVSMGRMGIGIVWNVLYLAGFAAVFYPLAIRAMRKRLIK